MVKVAAGDPYAAPTTTKKKHQKLFPSARLFVAFLLCLCFMSLAVATSNLAVSMVCMVRSNTTDVDTHIISERSVNSSEAPCNRKRRSEEDDDDDVSIQHCSQRDKLEWSSLEKGFVFAAQNVGSLTMLISGGMADKLNSKYTICVALILIVLSNVCIPLVASTSVWLVFVMRVITGMGDAFLFPSASSLITRWFPPKERPFAIGFATGGRQIGSLLILPVAGALCGTEGKFAGWPAIFYLSAIIGSVILIVWLLLSADKPSKHLCVSQSEQEYIARKIEEESVGKRTERGNLPWGKIFRCRALYVNIAALVCHEYPLVIMLQLLPGYLQDTLGLSGSMMGLVSALPIALLWISKTLSSSLSSLLTASKPPILSKTTSCKMFNFIASLGLGICVGITPLVEGVAPCVTLLCLANAFAGLHTPGVQTALVQIAPAYSGIITGLSFGVVAVFSIFNKLLSQFILKSGSKQEWTVVFEISAVVALLPVVFFTIWGSADREPWASSIQEQKNQKDVDTQSQRSGGSQATLTKYPADIAQDVSLP